MSADNNAEPRPTVTSKVLTGLVIVGLLVGGVAALFTYRDKSGQGQELNDKGVATDADVVSVRKSDSYTELNVSYDPPGDDFLEFAHVQDCSGARYEPGIETVRVVYLPDDPDVIRLESCSSSFDSDVLPGIVGIVFIVVSLFMLWRSRGLWRS